MGEPLGTDSNASQERSATFTYETVAAEREQSAVRDLLATPELPSLAVLDSDATDHARRIPITSSRQRRPWHVRSD
jgi:hypothetical protein